MDVDNTKALLKEADNFKRLAFFGIAISTVATLTAIIAVPMLYNYMQYVQSSLETELDFCRHRTGGLWEEYRRLMGPNARLKREASYQRGAGFTGGRQRARAAS